MKRRKLRHVAVETTVAVRASIAATTELDKRPRLLLVGTKPYRDFMYDVALYEMFFWGLFQYALHAIASSSEIASVRLFVQWQHHLHTVRVATPRTLCVLLRSSTAKHIRILSNIALDDDCRNNVWQCERPCSQSSPFANNKFETARAVRVCAAALCALLALDEATFSCLKNHDVQAVTLVDLMVEDLLFLNRVDVFHVPGIGHIYASASATAFNVSLPMSPPRQRTAGAAAAAAAAQRYVSCRVLYMGGIRKYAAACRVRGAASHILAMLTQYFDARCYALRRYQLAMEPIGAMPHVLLGSAAAAAPRFPFIGVVPESETYVLFSGLYGACSMGQALLSTTWSGGGDSAAGGSKMQDTATSFVAGTPGPLFDDGGSFLFMPHKGLIVWSRMAENPTDMSCFAAMLPVSQSFAVFAAYRNTGTCWARWCLDRRIPFRWTGMTMNLGLDDAPRLVVTDKHHPCSSHFANSGFLHTLVYRNLCYIASTFPFRLRLD